MTLGACCCVGVLRYGEGDGRPAGEHNVRDLPPPLEARAQDQQTSYDGAQDARHDLLDAQVFRPGPPRRLTTDGESDQNPLFSPSGAQIAFSTRRAHGSFDIWLMDADGNNATPLTSLANHDAVNLPGSAWCAKTNRIVYSSDASGQENLWTIKADGSGAKMLTDGPSLDREPTWSPSCDRVVFQSKRDDNWDIYVIRADGTQLRRLTNDSAKDWAPNWSPAGETILFQSKRSGRWKLYTVAANSGLLHQITTGSSEDTDCSWSRDGRYVVYSTDAGGNGGARIAILDVTTPLATPQLITQGDDYDGAPCWSPSGRTIAFESNRSGNLDIWLVDLW